MADKNEASKSFGEKDFKDLVVTEDAIELPFTPLVNTTVVGSTSVFKYLKDSGEFKTNKWGQTDEIHIVEFYNPATKEWQISKTGFRKQISEKVKSGSIKANNIYLITFLGSEKTKKGNNFNKYKICPCRIK